MYAVYSASDERPVIRGCYREEQRAAEAIPALRSADIALQGHEDDDYFVVELSDVEAAFYRSNGVEATD